MAKGDGAEIGSTKRGKGVKIIAIGATACLYRSARMLQNHHEVRMVQLCFDFYMVEAKPEKLIGDRAYDSDPLEEELCKDGIEMFAPVQSPQVCDARRTATSSYARRWLVEQALLRWILSTLVSLRN